MSDLQLNRKLIDHKGWDVPGLIGDVKRDLEVQGDLMSLEAAAVIETLMESMHDICKLIHHKHAERIDTDTIAKAATIAAKFVREPK